MDALIDTNVLINYVTNREDPYKEAPHQSHGTMQRRQNQRRHGIPHILNIMVCTS